MLDRRGDLAAGGGLCGLCRHVRRTRRRRGKMVVIGSLFVMVKACIGAMDYIVIRREVKLCRIYIAGSM